MATFEVKIQIENVSLPEEVANTPEFEAHIRPLLNRIEQDIIDFINQYAQKQG